MEICFSEPEVVPAMLTFHKPVSLWFAFSLAIPLDDNQMATHLESHFQLVKCKITASLLTANG